MGAEGGLAAALLWVTVAWAGGHDPPAHVLAEVLFCQRPWPSLGAAVTFDSDQLFWFDFPGSRWTPRLPNLPPWPPALETPAQLLQDATLCQDLRRAISQLVTGHLAEAKGVPMADVFSLRPPLPGEPNTLVCLVANVFPPAVEVTWLLDGVPITQGVTDTRYTPTADLAFLRFSYLNVTPAAGDIYTCVVTRQGDNASTIAYWVLQPPVAAEELQTALCGAAMALGTLLALLGVAMMVAARRGARGAGT